MSTVSALAGEYRVVYSGGSAVFTSPGGSTTKPYENANTGGWGNGGYVHHNGSSGTVNANASGTITAVLTWDNGGDLNDLPPKLVVVREDVSANWAVGGSNYTHTPGTRTHGLNSTTVQITVDTNEAIRGQVTAIGYRVIANPTDVITITANPSASSNCSCRPPFASALASAGANYKAQAYPLEILRNGQRLIGENRRVLPGEPNALSVTGADQSTTHLWAVPTETFKEYNPQTATAQVEEILPADTYESQFRFRWKRGDNDYREVKCTVLVGGTPVDVTGTIHVGKITGLLKAKASQVFYRDTGIVEYADIVNAQDRRGMSWNGSVVDLPPFRNAPPFSPGTYAFFQIGQISRSGFVDVGPAPDYKGFELWRLPSSYSTGVDERAPYAGLIFTTGTIATTALNAGDSPAQGFAAIKATSPLMVQSLEKLVIMDSFDTWLMYKSDVDGSNWVPVKKVHWFWSVVTTKYQTITSLFSTPVQEGEYTATFPEWSSVINVRGIWESIGSSEP